jgi:hypothetical protein
MADINIYYGTVTAGGTDGTAGSNDTESAPIDFGSLDLYENEVSDPVKLAIRCNSGFKSAAGTTITPTGTSASKIALAPDNSGSPGTWGSYGAALTFGSEIPDSNVVFWAKAKAVDTETPSNDTSVNLVIAPDISPE